MNSSLSKARVYAKAVFGVASETGEFVRWQDFLKSAAQGGTLLVKTRLFENPTVSYEQKLELCSCLAANFPEALNFLKLLLKKNLFALLPRIAELYQNLLLLHEGGVVVKVTLAESLNAEQQQLLVQNLTKQYGEKMVLQYVVDANILGGLVLEIGDKVLDYSIRAKLKYLKRTLFLKSDYGRDR